MKKDVHRMERTSLEKIGLQTMLLGMQVTLEKQIEMVNDTRAELGMDRVTVLFDGDSAPREHAAPIRALSAARQQQEHSENRGGPGKKRPAMRELWKRRMAILALAGVTNVRGFPSAKATEKAMRYLKKRNIPIPGEVAATPAAADTSESLTAPRKLDRATYSSISTKADWDLIKKAGLTSKRRPTRELKEKARKIIARREKAVAAALALTDHPVDQQTAS